MVRPIPIHGVLAGVLFVAAAAAASTAVAGRDKNEPTVRFGEIIVLRKEVFNPSVPGYNRFPFNFLNRLHMVTRENVIREQLLFKTGQPFDPYLLDESERVLRRFDFIGAVSIVALDEEDGKRTVVVETMDQWSTNVELEVDRFSKDRSEETDNSRDGFEVTVNESNILGYGKRIRARGRVEGDRSWYGYEYADPSLFDTRWIFKANYQGKRAGKEWQLLSMRPFYSLTTRWSLGAETSFRSEENSVYAGDSVAGVFYEELRRDRVFAGRTYGPREEKLLALVELSHLDNRYTDLSDVEGGRSAAVPPDETGPMVLAALRAGRFRFVEEKRIEHFIRVEDLELGSYAAIRFGRAATGRSRWLTGGQLASAQRVGRGKYVTLTASILADRKKGEWGETALSAEAQFHGRLARWNTVALRAAFDRRWRAQPGEELFAGENTGLRGYGPKAFAGQTRLLLNAEDRLFSGVQLFTVAFGGALFADAGTAWDEGEPIGLRDFSSSIGGGLRLGMTKSRESSVLRLDVARNLRNGSWRVAVASGQAFPFLRIYERFSEQFE